MEFKSSKPVPSEIPKDNPSRSVANELEVVANNIMITIDSTGNVSREIVINWE